MSEPVASPTMPRKPAVPRGSARLAWVERLQRFGDSGLTPAQFCAREGVALPTFYSWRRRLSADCHPAEAPPAADGAGPTLLPIRLAAPHAPLELALPSGAVVRVGAGADEASLRSLLRLLGVLPC